MSSEQGSSICWQLRIDSLYTGRGLRVFPAGFAFSDKGLAILQGACVSQVLILQYELYFS